MVGGGVVAVIVLVAAVVLGVTQLGGDDGPSDDPTASGGTDEPTEKKKQDDGPLSAAASDELRDTLNEQGWKCYDSVDEPVMVKRCFIAKEGSGEYSSPIKGQVAIQYQDDKIGSLRFRVSGSKDEAGVAPLVQQTSTTIGDTVLDDKGSQLAELSTQETTDPTEIDGARVSGNGAGVDIYDEDFDFEEVESPPLPSSADVQSALGSQGYSCGTEDELLSCEATKGSIRIRLIGSGESSGWSVSVSPADYDGGATIAQALTVAADAFTAAKIVGTDGAAFVKNDPPDGAEGDFDGQGISVIRSEVGDGDIFNALISVRPVS